MDTLYGHAFLKQRRYIACHYSLMGSYKRLGSPDVPSLERLHFLQKTVHPAVSHLCISIWYAASAFPLLLQISFPGSQQRE